MDEIQTLISAVQQVVDISKGQEKQTQQVVSKGEAYFWGMMFGITLAGLLHKMTHPTCEETLEETHEKKLRNHSIK